MDEAYLTEGVTGTASADVGTAVTFTGRTPGGSVVTFTLMGVPPAGNAIRTGHGHGQTARAGNVRTQQPTHRGVVHRSTCRRCRVQRPGVNTHPGSVRWSQRLVLPLADGGGARASPTAAVTPA